MDTFGFDLVRIEQLRGRPGAKWAKSPGLLAAWVADMDFAPAPVIATALRRLLDADDLGYPIHSPGPSPARDAFVQRMSNRFGWAIHADECKELNDVMQGVQIVIDLHTSPGDGVVVFMPSYPPFLDAVQTAGRRLEPVTMHRSADSATGWLYDLEALDAALRERPSKVLLLCHPHNPTGHVFAVDEQRELVALAERHDLLIVSDEIHADLTYAPHRHQPIARLAPDRTVTIHAASKAFNLAALRYAIMHIGPTALRERILGAPSHLFGAANLFGAEAARVAWTEGDDWLAAVVAHLDGQRMLVAELLAEHLPSVVYAPPAATYLAWLDCRALELGDDPAQEFRRRGVRLSEGPNFGSEGIGHARLNFATSSVVLREIIASMAKSSRT
jgi:cystathionine beta-lyase